MIQVEENKNRFKDKNILVVGLARSGTGAANLLSTLGAKVTITDKKSRSSLETNIKQLLPSIKVITNGNPQGFFDESDMIVISPGVPLNISPLIYAMGKGISIIGELELAYQAVAGCELRDDGSRNTHPATPHFIGVTGTNGKSTTTTLVDLMLKEAGYKTLLGGNIGNALTEEILKTVISCQLSVVSDEKNSSIPAPHLLPDFIVTEISSFQLESIKEFRPRIAAILNITPDHLDRYDSMSSYINAKMRIIENQTSEDYLILNADDPVVMKMVNERLEMGSEKLPKIQFFSREKEVEGVYFKKGKIYSNISLSSLHSLLPASHFPFISIDEIKINGVHNLENAMAASLAAMISGCPYQAVRDVLNDFPGLEHRLEYVGEINGIKFVNDSKGTNVGAVAKSLEGYENVILIMGGMDKGGNFSALKDLVKRKVKLLILIGEAKEKIAQAIGRATEIRKVNEIKEAVKLSMSRASAGDVVLLSPGCASFDMFADFEDRGRKFKEAVNEIKNANIKMQNDK